MADERTTRFVKTLSELERGDLARFKRCAGETIGSARGVTGLFYSILPEGVAGSRNEEIYFLVATLYGLNNKSQHPGGNFGVTMAKVKAESGSTSTDRRMAVLLDSEFDLIEGWRPGGGEMAYRLRQLVKLAAGKRIGIDWAQLLDDLTRWSGRDRKVRKQWAQVYFGGGEQPSEPAETATGEV